MGALIVGADAEEVRRWILIQLREFEEKYGTGSEEFYEKWVRAQIPELENPRSP